MLSGNIVNITGTHEAVAGGSSNAAIAASNPYVVGFDNKPTDDKNAINLSPYAPAVKVLRIAGKGQIRLRAVYRGKAWYFIQPKNGASGTGNAVAFPDHQTVSEGWSGIVNLTDDVNIIYLVGADWNHGGGSIDVFDNTIFEARTSSDPGLFRFMSSPL